MVDQSSVETQLKRIGFSQKAWGRQEVRELPNVLLPDEEIFECANGIYEGGFALLVATDVRVLLIDKKPLNYLTVEDLRFDMINEIDYYQRMLGAHVDITTGNRELKFYSYNNRARLRKLIGHVQHRMADIKKKQDNHQEGQYQHLQQINSHLRTYLIAQYKHQEELQKKLEDAQKGRSDAPAEHPEAPRPGPELSDYLLAQGLMESQGISGATADEGPPAEDLLAAGLKEVFGDKGGTTPGPSGTATTDPPPLMPAPPTDHSHMDINPLRVAYSKLPMALRNRKFGRPSLHAHSRAAKIAAPLAEPESA